MTEFTQPEQKSASQDEEAVQFKLVGPPLPARNLTADEARTWLEQPVTPRADARTITQEEATNA